MESRHFSETDIYQTHVSRHEMSKIVWDLIDISRSAYIALFHHKVVAKNRIEIGLTKLN